MIFTYRCWEAFCQKLQKRGIQSIPAAEVTGKSGFYVVLKHDVETDVHRAFQMAKIERKYGHRGSYYVQAYLLDKVENVKLLRQMQTMGHEISYHYDVMDGCKGDLDAAIIEFETNRKKFLKNGFQTVTVCQHGNPIVERKGYTSNRDFFRSERVRTLYPQISDIMVNFSQVRNTEFSYYSDAGRMFRKIYDPINNDIINSDDKNVPLENMDVLLNALCQNSGNIISVHPHRWTNFAAIFVIKTAFFKSVKFVAKQMIKIPVLKKIMSRYYYLAKKI